ncbi:MAG: hypothetical protein ACJAYU_004145 [Bradymonadia bacterium]
MVHSALNRVAAGISDLSIRGHWLTRAFPAASGRAHIFVGEGRLKRDSVNRSASGTFKYCGEVYVFAEAVGHIAIDAAPVSANICTGWARVRAMRLAVTERIVQMVDTAAERVVAGMGDSECAGRPIHFLAEGEAVACETPKSVTEGWGADLVPVGAICCAVRETICLGA